MSDGGIKANAILLSVGVNFEGEFTYENAKFE
jgi:hypothetical protein